MAPAGECSGLQWEWSGTNPRLASPRVYRAKKFLPVDSVAPLQASWVSHQSWTLSHAPHNRNVHTERGFDRLVNFSDAVVAIAITLLILPLVDTAATVGTESAGKLVVQNGYKLFVFVLSFAVIGQILARTSSHVRERNRLHRCAAVGEPGLATEHSLSAVSH